MFVKARSGEAVSLGIGKLVERQGDRCTVEYFDAPTTPPVPVEVAAEALTQATLPGQTRVYFLNPATQAWEIGRVLDDHGDSLLLQFPNGATKHLSGEHVFVRWSRPISDPTPFLANRITETPRFLAGRSAFVRTQTAQRGASKGVSALLASAIELEAHQVEVVRRVLEDPIQRYLLADEVGLGKTIEACVLIRQCMLDAGDGAQILVLVPRALVQQWRSELANRFFLEGSLDRSIHVAPLEDEAAIEQWLPDADMLVIDEAHHLAGRDVYKTIAAAAQGVERVLLLSATPALHNERGFLEMLHLLDPQSYPLDAEESFRRKVRERQSIAEIVASLTPENALQLDFTLDQLEMLFPDDQLLLEHAQRLRAVLDGFPPEDDPDLIDGVGAVRAHISEVYRLHRRILRHRRRSVGGLTPDRAGVQWVEYASPARAALTEAIESWRFEEANEATDAEAAAVGAMAGWRLLDRVSQYPRPDGDTALSAEPVLATELFRRALQALARSEHHADRTAALVKALPSLLAERAHIVVFCSDPSTADTLASDLKTEASVPVYRHQIEKADWAPFLEEAGSAILVCDHRAEEGLNLQGGRKVVVHYDLPLNANRIEQRLGRTDRYGSGDAVRSMVLLCEEDPIEAIWFEYLHETLKVFDRSVASLQYLIEQTTNELSVKLFLEGADALNDLIALTGGEQGLIEREIRALDQQDALDSLGAPPSAMLDELAEVDDDWRTIAADTSLWVETTLQFAREEVAPAGGAPLFRYLYTVAHPRTLIPLQDFTELCRSALDLSASARGGRAVRTIPYTFSRRAVLTRQARRLGAGLLRYGEPFIEGITRITEADDRGRSSAVWRHDPEYRADFVADLFFRFDFVVEVDLEPLEAVLEGEGLLGTGAKPAMRRRGDMCLPPFFATVWLNHELLPVEDSEVLARLNRPYAPEGQGARDLNLNGRRWGRLLKLDLPVLENWADLCAAARTEAEAVIRRRSDLVDRLFAGEQQAMRIEHGRLGQLRARAALEAVGGGTGAHELRVEEALSMALRSGIRAPRIRVDAVGATFLSGDPRTADVVDGGA